MTLTFLKENSFIDYAETEKSRTLVESSGTVFVMDLPSYTFFTFSSPSSKSYNALPTIARYVKHFSEI